MGHAAGYHANSIRGNTFFYPVIAWAPIFDCCCRGYAVYYSFRSTRTAAIEIWSLGATTHARFRQLVVGERSVFGATMSVTHSQAGPKPT